LRKLLRRPSSPRTVGGIGFVAAFIAGVIAYGSGAGSTDADITSYYASHGNRLHQIVGFALIVVAIVLFVGFVAGLAGVLPPGSSIVALVSGGCAATLLLAANALWASSALTIELEPGYRIDPRTHLLFEDAGFALLVSAAAVAVPLVAAVSLSAAYARWFALTGIVVGAALATSYWYFPFFVFLAWVGVAAVLEPRGPTLAE
jgi:hypothetical protein